MSLVKTERINGSADPKGGRVVGCATAATILGGSMSKARREEISRQESEERKEHVLAFSADPDAAKERKIDRERTRIMGG